MQLMIKEIRANLTYNRNSNYRNFCRKFRSNKQLWVGIRNIKIWWLLDSSSNLLCYRKANHARRFSWKWSLAVFPPATTTIKFLRVGQLTKKRRKSTISRAVANLNDLLWTKTQHIQLYSTIQQTTWKVLWLIMSDRVTSRKKTCY